MDTDRDRDALKHFGPAFKFGRYNGHADPEFYDSESALMCASFIAEEDVALTPTQSLHIRVVLMIGRVLYITPDKSRFTRRHGAGMSPVIYRCTD